MIENVDHIAIVVEDLDSAENNYKKINFTTESEFQKFLNARGLTLEKFEKKLIIEALWNELIF